MRPLLLVAFFFMFTSNSFAQADTTTTDGNKKALKIVEQIFLPSIEIGYLFNQAQALEGGILIKTSIEYRSHNVEGLFLRISYDQYSANFTLNPDNGLTNVIKGTASFSDLLFGLGYRLGDRKFRGFLMIQPGIKYYNFPEFVQNGLTTNIDQTQRNTFTTRVTLGLEYYLTDKSAFSIDFIQSQVWQSKDFWEDSGSAIGFSIGFITALF